jgi:hypothetical protein
MYHFIEISHPVHNGVVMPHCNLTNDHTQLQEWLTQNYPNFDLDNFNTARARQMAFIDPANRVTPTVWADNEPGEDFYSKAVFWNVPGATPSGDPEFRSYVEFFLTHSGWDTPGYIREFVIENQMDIPLHYYNTGALEY